MNHVVPSSLPRGIILAVFTSLFVVLTGTGSFAQTDADKMGKKKREYLRVYCRYQTILEDQWIAALEKEISDEALDVIKKKAVKERDDKAHLLPETLSALRHRARVIYKKKRAERAIEFLEEYLFTKNIEESYNGDPPSKADCEKFSVEEIERRQKEAEQQQLEARERHAKLEKVLAQSTTVMVHVPGGPFTMGCTPEERNCGDDEKPAHQVEVNSFQIGKYEVTQELWQVVMGGNPSKFENCSQCPVENVAWNQIQAFLDKLNKMTGERYRLPTEAEWEYAARGGQQSKGYEYAGSNEAGTVAWYKENSGGKPNRVGQKQPNELGLYDMSGNVKEWVQDCWNKTYVGAPRDGSAWEQGNCNMRVTRGGSWKDRPGELRSANRNGNWDTVSRDGLFRGFRLARTLP